MDTIKEVSWFNCYKANWNAAPLVPEAYSHPAKVAFGLAQKIYTHMLEQGYIKPGDKVVDPFGGIGGFAFHAMRYGLNWQGVELEPKFVALAQANIDLWESRYSAHFPNWGSAKIAQGDSRQLGAILAGMDGAVSSPPYAKLGANIKGHGIKQDIPGKLGNNESYDNADYGRTPGQLGAMPQGSHDAAVSSPAYADTIKSGEGPGARHDHKYHNGANATKNSSDPAYGTSGGQLGQMRYDGSLSSPPYQTGGHHQHQMDAWNTNGRGQPGHSGGYADESDGQLQGTGATFWTAAREIVQQTYNVLKPGAYTAWVCGDFVRQGKRVYFGKQWMELCQSVGFEPVEWAIAWKTEYKGHQLDIFGNSHEKRIDRVSFFRRLANEKNPDNAILNEDVIFMRKPL